MKIPLAESKFVKTISELDLEVDDSGRERGTAGRDTDLSF
jgi:hypothetical protein